MGEFHEVSPSDEDATVVGSSHLLSAAEDHQVGPRLEDPPGDGLVGEGGGGVHDEGDPVVVGHLGDFFDGELPSGRCDRVVVSGGPILVEGFGEIPRRGFLPGARLDERGPGALDGVVVDVPVDSLDDELGLEALRVHREPLDQVIPDPGPQGIVVLEIRALHHARCHGENEGVHGARCREPCLGPEGHRDPLSSPLL